MGSLGAEVAVARPWVISDVRVIADLEATVVAVLESDSSRS